MPGLSILKINEIFWSFQGEGQRLGVPSIFLRLAGCTVQCPYCDSKDSWRHDRGTFMPLEKILSEIKNYKNKFPQSQVVITGGEPLEQDLTQITAALKNENIFICIETNGNHFQDLPIDWWTISPKDITGYFIHENILNKVNEIKLIVNINLTIDAIQEIRSLVPVPSPIFLQPDEYDKKRYSHTFSLFQKCQEAKLDNIRCGVQLHKIYKVK